MRLVLLSGIVALHAELQNRRAEDTNSLHIHIHRCHQQTHSDIAGMGGSGCQCCRTAAVLGLFALESWW